MTHAEARRRLAAIARQWMSLWTPERDWALFDKLHDPNFVDRAPAGRSPDRTGFRQSLIDLYGAVPDFKATIESLVIDDESGTVAVGWIASGTHEGEFLGHAPTGKQLAFRIEIIRIEADRIIEGWGEWNGLDLLDQVKARS